MGAVQGPLAGVAVSSCGASFGGATGSGVCECVGVFIQGIEHNKLNDILLVTLFTTN